MISLNENELKVFFQCKSKGGEITFKIQNGFWRSNTNPCHLTVFSPDVILTMIYLAKIICLISIHKLCRLGKGGQNSMTLLSKKKTKWGEGVKNRRFWDDITSLWTFPNKTQWMYFRNDVTTILMTIILDCLIHCKYL